MGKIMNKEGLVILSSLVNPNFVSSKRENINTGAQRIQRDFATTRVVSEQTTARTVEAFGTRPVAEKSAERTTTSEDNALTKSGNTFKH